MNSHRSLTKQLGVLALLLLGTAAAIPQQPGNRYTVEIVVFRNGGQAAALTDATRPAAGGDDVEPTIIPTRRLGGAASRLRATSGMHVLAHTAWTQGATAWNSRRGVSAARLGLDRAGISGKIALERGQFLNLRIDLTVEDGGRQYQISEVRRNVKADEIQYIDHPAVGVLAVITAGG